MEESTQSDARLQCIYELGYALMYMNHLHPMIDWEPQKSRVMTLIQRFKNMDYYEVNTESPVSYADLLKDIQDEIENMC